MEDLVLLGIHGAEFETDESAFIKGPSLLPEENGAFRGEGNRQSGSDQDRSQNHNQEERADDVEQTLDRKLNDEAGTAQTSPSRFVRSRNDRFRQKRNLVFT